MTVYIPGWFILVEAMSAVPVAIKAVVVKGLSL